jgi:DNA modification methylase
VGSSRRSVHYYERRRKVERERYEADVERPEKRLPCGHLESDLTSDSYATFCAICAVGGPSPLIFSDVDCTLWHGDALRHLRELPDESIDAVVTSPPYGDQRTYGGVPPDFYAQWLGQFFLPLERILKPTGSVMLNLGRIFRNGEEHSYLEQTLLWLRKAGWARIDTIVWAKTKAMPMGPPYLNNRHEFVYWLAQNTKAYRGYDEVRVPHALETVARYERGNLRGQKDGDAYTVRERPPLNPLGMVPPSVFSCSVGSEAGNPHPAPMALELAEHLVRLACPPGGTVLDPFAGSGTTAVAARKHGRKTVLIEQNLGYCEFIARRLGQQSLLAVPSGL